MSLNNSRILVQKNNFTVLQTISAVFLIIHRGIVADHPERIKI